MDKITPEACPQNFPRDVWEKVGEFIVKYPITAEDAAVLFTIVRGDREAMRDFCEFLSRGIPFNRVRASAAALYREHH